MSKGIEKLEIAICENETKFQYLLENIDPNASIEKNIEFFEKNFDEMYEAIRLLTGITSIQLIRAVEVIEAVMNILNSVEKE